MTVLSLSTFFALNNIFSRPYTYYAYTLYYLANIALSLYIIITCFNLSSTKSEQLGNAEPFANFMKKCLVNKVEGFEVPKWEFDVKSGSVAPTLLFELLLQVGMALSLCAFISACQQSKWNDDSDDNYVEMTEEPKTQATAEEEDDNVSLPSDD